LPGYGPVFRKKNRASFFGALPVTARIGVPIFPHSIRIFVTVEPVDMRKQYDRLWAAAQEPASDGTVIAIATRQLRHSVGRRRLLDPI
jgi:hypothetical protein